MKKLRILFLLAGLVIASVLIYKIGWKNIIRDLLQIKWWFFIVLIINLIWYICYTLAWKQALKKIRSNIPFLDLLRAKIAGEAVNTSNPASFLSGDPVRIFLLKRHIPLTEGAASVVIDRTLHSMAVIILIFVGAVAAFWKLPFIPTNMRFGVPIVLLISIIFMAFIFVHQHKGFFEFWMTLLKRLKIKKSFSQKNIERFDRLDDHIRNFYLTNKKGFWTALSLHCLGRLLGVLEVYIIGRCFSGEFTIFAALLLSALAPIVYFIFTFIPGALGVLEGASSGVLYLLNINPSLGVSIQVIRRLRSAFWIGIGFIILGSHDRRKALKTEIALSS